MADKPILFSGPMVRALIAGTKTQTRRTFNPQPTMHEAGDCTVNGHRGSVDYLMREIAPKHWLRIAVGDRLYVRESLTIKSNDQDVRWLGYAADGKDVWPLTQWTRGTKGIPSIHAPRWTSRITLTVTDVRVDRLQDIGEADAKAEGATFFLPANHLSHGGWSHDEWYVSETAKQSYEGLWDRINGEGAWAKNPWVAAYTFTVERGNIDQLRAPA